MEDEQSSKLLFLFLCSMNRTAAFEAFNLALAVSLGALGAHFLKEHLDPSSMISFQTGVRYHIYHSLSLLVFAGFPLYQELKKPVILMSIGMLLFSVSIYLLSTRGLLFSESSLKWLGPITPVGGLCLIVAWLWIGISMLISKK